MPILLYLLRNAYAFDEISYDTSKFSGGSDVSIKQVFLSLGKHVFSIFKSGLLLKTLSQSLELHYNYKLHYIRHVKYLALITLSLTGVIELIGKIIKMYHFNIYILPQSMSLCLGLFCYCLFTHVLIFMGLGY